LEPYLRAVFLTMAAHIQNVKERQYIPGKGEPSR
jgi:hypothetical protein